MDISGVLSIDDSFGEAYFAANLRRLREAKKFSQGELANRVTSLGMPGVHQTTVSRIEKGERPVRLGEARAIAEALEARLEDMIEAPEKNAVRDRLEYAIRERWAAAEAVRSAAASFVLADMQLEEVVLEIEEESTSLEDEAIDEALGEANISLTLPALVEPFTGGGALDAAGRYFRNADRWPPEAADIAGGDITIRRASGDSQ